MQLATNFIQLRMDRQPHRGLQRGSLHYYHGSLTLQHEIPTETCLGLTHVQPQSAEALMPVGLPWSDGNGRQRINTIPLHSTGGQL